MRLEKIKLSGFKSFVDPTTIPISGNLVGIVGPNGCGKSNIIDAVRWVMGESSAKHLRGGTMADVIFNGSASRKPVGVASVELVFDNSARRLGGEYAGYSTIAIKRQVSRDGQSVYLLNGARCRRKDITDIFLGTGLGSRSYAIIEQGTISRLIEAKPDDLRVLIEEAAGVSKYKERRHETEIRIRHTRENLDRLNDVLDEVGKRIDHLRRQAKKAEKYTSLKTDERRYKQELLALRWRSHQDSVQAFEANANEKQQQLNELLLRKTELDKQLSSSGDAHAALQQNLNAVQGEVYAVTSEIGRLEQTIETADQAKQDIQIEITRIERGSREALDDLNQDEQQLHSLQHELTEAQKHLEAALILESESVDSQQRAEEDYRALQSEWDSVKTTIALANEIRQVESSRVTQFSEQAEQYRDRQARLLAQQAELGDSELETEIETLNDELESLHAQHTTILSEIDDAKQHAQNQRDRIKKLTVDLDRLRSVRQEIQGQISSLETLQQHATGRDRSALNQWLTQVSLDESPRLAQHLDVDTGWENAVEMVLGNYLQSLCVQDTTSVFSQFESMPQDSLAMIEPYKPVSRRADSKQDKLVDKLKSDWNITGLLSGVYCAKDIDQAQKVREKLEIHESVITRDGLWFGPGWVYVNRGNDEHSGVLRREKDLRALRQKRTDIVKQYDVLEQEMLSAEQTLAEAEQIFAARQQSEQSLSVRLSDNKSRLSACNAKFDQVNRRLSQIGDELEEVRQNLAKAEKQSADSKQKFLAAEQEHSGLMTRTEGLSVSCETARQKLEQFIQEMIEARDRVRGLRSRIENLKSSEQLTDKHLQRLVSQRQIETDRLEQLKQKLGDTDLPLQDYQTQLTALAGKRQALEQDLKAARGDLSGYEQNNTELSEQRAGLEQNIDHRREQLEKVRMDSQASLVRSQTISEQLVEMKVDAQTVLQDIEDDASEPLWSEKVEQLAEKIARLGSINLAAIQEHDEESQRLEYLNAQHEDLSESLETLETAMKKIDGESKARFKSTFDQINNGLQKNFPKLFGGGQANLELTEQNLLETGVNVIARPPGKRNSSIHLLSGGEKALTAVALVFSIFELNPAPFCLLDEVDAPLDDANVGRFRALIEEMSHAVQFIFITHNKATMEVARHLTGVTMNEPGVSRMVAVDIDEAVELAVG